MTPAPRPHALPQRLLPGAVGPLRTLAATLLARAGDLVGHWRTHYLSDHGEDGYFTSETFLPEHEEEVRRLLRAVSAGDAGEVGRLLAERGRRLHAMGVPFGEVISSLHAFEEACIDVLRRDGAGPAELLAGHVALDRLSHVRIVLLAEAYFGEAAAAAEGRMESLEERLTARPSGRDRLCGLVGAAPSMQLLYDRIEAAARGRETVLITGESGTGKELVARALHALSGDPPERFVAVNCAALPRELMESELFGHRRGAFSGAQSDRPGLVRSAAGGTLFLDEITELPTEAQAKLLRSIQERSVRPVGGVQEVPVDLRIAASTNRAPEEAVAGGQLRRDLYYRLRRLVLPAPPLRRRIEDIPALAAHFLERWAAAHPAEPPRRLTAAALQLLRSRPWPGNVRELENAIFSACAFAAGAQVRVEDLEAAPRAPHPAPPEGPVNLSEAERQTIERALRSAEGNKSLAARLLGISRKQLYVKLRLYGLEA